MRMLFSVFQAGSGDEDQKEQADKEKTNTGGKAQANTGED